MTCIGPITSAGRTGRLDLVRRGEVGGDDREGDAALLRDPLELADQVEVALDGDDLVPVAGEVQRHPAGAGAELGDRATGLVGQLHPDGQVGAVGAELDLLPDRRGAHCQ